MVIRWLVLLGQQMGQHAHRSQAMPADLDLAKTALECTQGTQQNQRLAFTTRGSQVRILPPVMRLGDASSLHIRRLARRIDKGSVPYDRIELLVSHKMQSALDFLHEESELREGDKPNPAMVVVARAKTQAIAICDLARELHSFGVKMDLDEIERQLERDREAMSYRLEIWISDAPNEVEPITVAKDYYELIFDPQQELLLRIDFALDEVERRAASD